MSLDIRLPTGILFGIIGLILVGFGLGPVVGLWSSSAIYERSLGINVNLIWGLCLLVFAAVMLALAFRARRVAQVLQKISEPSQQPDS
ncbi:MAG: hypothetical protein ACLQNE_13620 [Thermoguttaceae bacterium]|jgi:predicted MFS family arabinose efflux permease